MRLPRDHRGSFEDPLVIGRILMHVEAPDRKLLPLAVPICRINTALLPELLQRLWHFILPRLSAPAS